MIATLKNLLFSLLALLGGLIALALVTTVASWLPPLLRLQPDSAAQLIWDLVFTVLGGIVAVGFTTRHAPRWPRSHGSALWLLIAAAALWACLSPQYDLPHWFVVVLLFSLPVQLVAGLYLGRRSARSR